MSNFPINDFITLRLEDGKTNIYVNNELFIQCKFLLLNIPADDIDIFNDIESIDEATEKLDKSMEGDSSDYFIPPETEFWAHCSNLQVWAENNYNTRLIHSNLAFPLLKKLTEVGDLIARKVFKEEISKRFFNGTTTVQKYLYEEGYLNYLSKDELFSVIDEDLNVIKGLEKIINKEIRIKTKNIPTGQGIAIEDRKIISLTLQNCDLKKFPKQIKGLSNLEILRLNGNLLEFIPEWINELKELSVLEIQHNILNELPESLGELKNLNILKLDYNQLEALPESIGNLTNLERLDLNSNRIERLPKSIGNLKSLEVLNINQNNIRSIPNSFGDLMSLKECNLIGNSIKSMPPSTINLMSLKSLNLMDNPLNNFPESVLNLQNLKTIFLEGSRIKISNRIKQKLKEKKIEYYY